MAGRPATEHCDHDDPVGTPMRPAKNSVRISDVTRNVVVGRLAPEMDRVAAGGSWIGRRPGSRGCDCRGN